MGSAKGEYKVGQLSALFKDNGAQDEKLASLFSVKPNKKRVVKKTEPVVDEQASESGSDSETEQKNEIANESESEESKNEAIGNEKKDKAEDNEQDDKGKTEKDNRTLFVGGVPLKKAVKKTQKDVLQHFRQFATVESVRIRSVPIQATAVPSGANYKVMRKASIVQGKVDASDSTTCNAYVVFKSKEDLEKVLESGESNMINGVRVRLDRVGLAAKDLFDRRRTVFVGNLPFTATDAEISEYFNTSVKSLLKQEIKEGKHAASNLDLNVPSVEQVRVVRDKMSNMGKGFAYICFAVNEGMECALRLNDKEFQSRKLRVNRCKRSATLVRPGTTAQGGKGKRSAPTGVDVKRVKKPRHVPRTGGGAETGSSNNSKAVAAASASLAYQGVRANRQAAGLRIRTKKSLQQKMQQKAKASSKAKSKHRHAKLKKAAKTQGKKKVPTHV